MEITFSKPHKFEDETYESIELDLDGLTAADMMDAYRQYSAAGNFSAVTATDPNFQVLIAAAAANQPVEFFTKMRLPDFNHVCQAVQNFLFSSDSVNLDSTATSEKSASSSRNKQKQA